MPPRCQFAALNTYLANMTSIKPISWVLIILGINMQSWYDRYQTSSFASSHAKWIDFPGRFAQSKWCGAVTLPLPRKRVLFNAYSLSSVRRRDHWHEMHSAIEFHSSIHRSYWCQIQINKKEMSGSNFTGSPLKWLWAVGVKDISTVSNYSIL